MEEVPWPEPELPRALTCPQYLQDFKSVLTPGSPCIYHSELPHTDCGQAFERPSRSQEGSGGGLCGSRALLPWVLKKGRQLEGPVQEQRNLCGSARVSGRRPFPGTQPSFAPPLPHPPRSRPGRRRPGAPGSLAPAAAGIREGKPGPPGTSARSSGPERLPHRLLLQMLLLPPRPPHPPSSPEPMDPPSPKAPPFPKTEGPSSTPSSVAGPRPPLLDRHLLIDANGVPYTYTVPPPEEEPRPPPPRVSPPPEPSPRKGYSCPECARVFASPLRLQSHRVSHSDLKPFTCGACGKAFKRSSHLSRHRATHRARAGPPHTCPLCPRRFQDAAELAQHMRLH
ncbi:zinc finger protein 580 [Sturnira hondurensis]|uniref:zinc finger protein 580 n=1 Tax=Sturnira hondurensis TaxID=192404 RepID=UPI001879E92C|nr:zinc finger protein 580 [Sturnira hondurensis]